jgi:protein-L-isoaspartate O-methyltransferase
VSPHPVGLLAVFLLVTGWSTEEILADIAVSEAADQVGALLDRLQHPGILVAEWIETTITATILEHGTAHRRAQFLKRGGRLDGSQGLKIALIGRL